jgi:anti-sigma factor ChrR (cupin superfamily)
MLRCKEAVAQADGLLDGSLNRRQRFAMKLHLLICSHCRRYVRQFRALLKAVPFMHRPATDAEVDHVMKKLRGHD